MNKFIFWIGRKAVNGIVTGMFFVLAVLGIAYAAINWPVGNPGGTEVTGGKFTTIFNSILQSSNYLLPGDGTVKNSQKLNGLTGTSYQKRVTGSCSVGQSITTINADGTVSCGMGGGSGRVDYSSCTTIYHSEAMAIGTNCGGIITTASNAQCPTDYLLVSDSTGLRFP